MKLMDYKLAQLLEDARLPRGRAGRWVQPDGTLRPPNSNIYRVIYAPTLEELIEACGKLPADFEALTKEHSQAGNEWVASSFHPMGGMPIKYGRGKKRAGPGNLHRPISGVSA
jgi:hypothetical protein